MTTVRILFICFTALVMACASTGARRPSSAPAALIVGVSEIDVTPEEPIRLTGYSSRTVPSEGIGQRLWAKALAFGDRRHAAVLISVDVIGLPRTITDEVARRLEKHGIERAHVAIGATHTHTGPSLAGFSLPFSRRRFHRTSRPSSSDTAANCRTRSSMLLSRR